jgi:hypothetical protein
MSLAQQVIGWLSVLQGSLLFGTLLWRRHYRTMPLFTMYVGGNHAFNTIYGLHPTWETWMLLQVVNAALHFGVALELTYRLFGAFPGAAVTVRRVMLVILAFTAVTAIATAPPDATYTRMHAEEIPRMASAAIWMLTVLAGLVLWYRLPLAPLPRAILMGLAPYLLLSTIGMSLLFGPESARARPWVGYVIPLASLALTNYWLRVAWRTAPDSANLPPPPTPPATTAPVRGRAAS